MGPLVLARKYVNIPTVVDIFVLFPVNLVDVVSNICRNGVPACYLDDANARRSLTASNGSTFCVSGRGMSRWYTG